MAVIGRLLPGCRRLPEVVERVRLARGERRVAWALTADGEAVVAATAGLYLPGQQRLEWADIERVSWKRPALRVQNSAEVEGGGARTSLVLTDEGDLPDAVRTHVSASVGWSAHYRITGGGVRVVGRRRAGRELLDWQLVYDAGTDPHDPLVRTQAEDLLLAARRTVG